VLVEALVATVVLVVAVVLVVEPVVAVVLVAAVLVVVVADGEPVESSEEHDAEKIAGAAAPTSRVAMATSGCRSSPD
jgi:hypothetical protein